MKRVISMVIALVLCICLASPVLAAEFVPSITGKPAPEIVPEKDDEGNAAIAALLDEDGLVVGHLYEDCLVITSVSEANTSQLIPDDAKQTLLDVYGQLSAGTMNLPYDKFNAGLDASEMVIRDLFDASWLCGDHPEQIAPKGITVRVTFDLGVGKNTDVYCMSYKNSEWNPIVDLKNNGDGTVTCTFEDFCPIAFAVKSGSDSTPSKTGDETDVILWVVLMSVSVVALGAVVLLSRRKVAR